MPTTKDGVPIHKLRTNFDHRNAPLRQIVQLQQRLLELALKKGIKPQVVATLVNSYTAAEEKRQILTGYGRPKPVEARNSRSKSKRPAGQTVLGDDPSAELPNVAAPAKTEPEAHNP